MARAGRHQGRTPPALGRRCRLNSLWSRGKTPPGGGKRSVLLAKPPPACAYASSRNEDGAVATISNEAWHKIESACRLKIPTEAHDEIDEATAAFVNQATSDIINVKPALQRIDRVRAKAQKLRDEWAKGRDLARGSDAFFADILIARNYPVPHSGETAPPWDDLDLVIRACNAAQAELAKMQGSGPASRRQLISLAWNRWIVELSSISRTHDLTRGPGVTQSKRGVLESKFGKLVRALQKHALPPGDWPHLGSSVEALDKAIKRALSPAAQGRD